MGGGGVVASEYLSIVTATTFKAKLLNVLLFLNSRERAVHR